ncbi:MAG TPA: hypothetical protein VJB87_00750 [Candidatus Nanoarchaeia archaeon]|nr:hypothetical protein [Candidatus Nanoarchaeia archaeon]
MEEPLHEVCIKILRRMYNQHLIGGKHQPEVYYLKKIQYYPREEQKMIHKQWTKLIQEQWILIKQKPTERHISLNPEKLGDIRRSIGL